MAAAVEAAGGGGDWCDASEATRRTKRAMRYEANKRRGAMRYARRGGDRAVRVQISPNKLLPE